MASGAGASRSSGSSNRSLPRYVVCVDPADNDDLQARRIYRTIPDSVAARVQLIRVVDDSGEDYLYPSRLFLPLTIPRALRQVLERSA